MRMVTKSAQDAMAETTAQPMQPEEVALYSLVVCAADRGAVFMPRRGRSIVHPTEVHA